MKLLTQALRRHLPTLYSQEKIKDPIVHAKFFTPDSNWTWFATEGRPEGDDFLFFGYVIGLDEEWGYFCLSELQAARGPLGLPIERDLYFRPGPFSEVINRHRTEHHGTRDPSDIQNPQESMVMEPEHKLIATRNEPCDILKGEWTALVTLVFETREGDQWEDSINRLDASSDPPVFKSEQEAWDFGEQILEAWHTKQGFGHYQRRPFPKAP